MEGGTPKSNGIKVCHVGNGPKRTKHKKRRAIEYESIGSGGMIEF